LCSPAIALLAGCSAKGVSIDLSTFHDAKSFLLAVPRGGSLEVHAIETSSVADRVATSDGARLTLIPSPFSLEELTLRRGLLMSSSDPHSRSIATPLGAYSAALESGGLTRWTMLAGLPAELSHFQLPPLDAAQCAARRACFNPGDEYTCVSCNPPAPPRAPERPQLLPCPSGWTTVMPAASDDDVATCAPPVLPPRVPCADDQLQLLGDRCLAVGSPCGASEWAGSLPVGSRIIYVRANAVGGSGTMAAPFGGVRSALAAAQPGDVIALGAGTFTGSIALPSRVTLFGKCVSQTVLEIIDTTSVITARGKDAAIQNLTVRSNGDGLSIPQASSMSIQNVAILSSGPESRNGILANGGTVTGTIVAIRGFQQFGISIWSGAMRLSTLDIEDAVTGIHVEGAGATATISSVAVVGSHPSSLLPHAVAIGIDSGASTSIHGAILDADGTVGMAVGSLGTQAQATDLYIRAVPPSMLANAAAVNVTEGAALDAERVSIVSPYGSGLYVGSGSCNFAHVVADRWAVAGALGPAASPAGDVTFRRSSFERSGGLVGLKPAICPTPARLRLEDVVIRHSHDSGDDDILGGDGIYVPAGAFTAKRLWVTDTKRVAIELGVTATASISDFVVRRSSLAGLAVSGTGYAGATRGEISDATYFGLCADLDAQLIASDIFVSNTRPSSTISLGRSSCSPPESAGSGLRALNMAIVAVTRFAFDNNQGYGVSVDSPGVSLSNGIISRSPIGAQVGGSADGLRLLSDVLYQDDGVALVKAANGTTH
jgi:hypothetical protein